ncbi:hypothetical protein CGZ93_02650 [Enemella dayhoffiae]|uniref:Uncharacterized protein n=1 Tax=Enemella dayhoffiae TaxID=2016507 RepID=A0A255HAE7_9ACTN|nr:hypothetical protein [Enemella dayhoffiae]OYO24619.1 hypothetical protein CGZ93_02650 [Enemella dayhoffiae]
MLTACAGTPTRTPAGGGAPPTQDPWPSFVAELGRALTDPAATAALIDPRAATADPTLPAATEQLRANLAQFRVELRPGTRTATPPPERTARLGGGVQVRELIVDWRLPEEATTAEHKAYLTVVERDGRFRLAGLTDAPADSTRQQPIWLQRPITVTRGTGVAVIATPDRDPAPWLAALSAAREPLSRHGLRPPQLVAQLPNSAADFERMLGVPTGSRRDIAAAAWTEGPAVRIMINPEAGGATGDTARQLLITHEATHVATGTVRLPGPLWFAEGYADLVALGDQPAAAGQLTTLLAADQRTHGPAAGPPSDQELAAGTPRLQAHYTRAWLAARVLDRGDGSTDRVVQALRAGRTWPEALAAAGWTQPDLDRAVAAELARIVGR